MLERRKKQAAIDKEGEGLHLAAELRDGGTLIGHFSLLWESQEHRQGEIGFVLHPDQHGQGMGSKPPT